MRKRAAWTIIACILQISCRHRAPGRDAGPPAVLATAPAGYVEGHVLHGTSKTAGGGSMLLLAESSETVALPIFIGGTEAMTIDLRLKGDRYARPLTHDLLSETIHELGGRAVQVQVDELVSDTYRGTVVLERGDGSFVTLDARPSDCIALSLGEHVPIYVRKQLLDDEGVPVSAGSGAPRRL
ncbi:MAG TPA: bifunctional nuclease family protein [Polyangiaceae bacterium]|jgi:hypothetical protein